MTICLSTPGRNNNNNNVNRRMVTHVALFRWAVMCATATRNTLFLLTPRNGEMSTVLGPLIIIVLVPRHNKLDFGGVN